MDPFPQIAASPFRNTRHGMTSTTSAHIQRAAAVSTQNIPGTNGTSALTRNLIEEWDCLAQTVGAAPYLQPGWIRAWWQAFGNQGELLLQSVRTSGVLTAIAPVIRHRGSLFAAANEHSPDFDIVASDRHAAMQLAHNLYMSNPTYLSMPAVTRGNAVMRYVCTAAKSAGHTVIARNWAHSPYLPVAGSFPDYEARLNHSFVSGLNRSYRRLRRNGNTSVQLADCADDLDRLLDEAFSVEASGWKGNQGTAIASRPETRSFYRAIAFWAAERNMLRLYFLRVAKRPIAMYFGLAQHGICYLLKGGYDESFARFSPGKLLMRELIEHCFATGISRIDFLGNATPHKLCWTSCVHERYRIETFAPTASGIFTWVAIGHAKPALNRGFSAVRAALRAI